MRDVICMFIVFSFAILSLNFNGKYRLGFMRLALVLTIANTIMLFKMQSDIVGRMFISYMAVLFISYHITELRILRNSKKRRVK